MVEIEYANAYSEVLEILKFIPKADYEKIDKETINVFEANHNKDYIFNYEPSKTLNEQNASKITKTIIAILFRDYWATDIQREKILAKEKYDLEKIEEEKREVYNPDNIFKKKDKEETENKDLIVYDNRKWFQKVFESINSLIKRIFNK